MGNPAPHIPSADNMGVEDADLHASSDEHAPRYEDNVCRLMMYVPEHISPGMSDQNTVWEHDVGDGRGQVAVPLMNASKAVTVLPGSAECSNRLQDFISD